jgi:hypothetical protein
MSVSAAASSPPGAGHAHRHVGDPALGGSGAADSPSGDIPSFELAALTFSIGAGSGSPTPPPGATQWLAILGLGPGPVGLAFWVWDFGIKHGDIRMLGVAAYGAPVLSTRVVVAAGFAQPTLSLALACALIVEGALIASWRRKARRKKAGARPALNDGDCRSAQASTLLLGFST